MEAFPVPAGTGCLFSDLKPHLEGKKKKTALLCGQWRKPNSGFTPYFLIGRKRGSCSFRKRKKAPVRKRIGNF